MERSIETLDELEGYFTSDVPEDEPHRVEVLGRENGSLRIRVIEKATGAAQVVTIPIALFQSGGYRSLQGIHERLVEAAGSPPFTVTMGKLVEAAHTFEQLRPRILELAQEGLNLQRFKGLGEMNPDTLKMTTLDPKTRQPLRVTVKDGEQLRTDQMISDLMGKDVAARFKMITENAADIGELDV